MIPEASLQLLEQDNSIPGNRKDGFRYRYLLFIIVATPIYLWLELSFGVRLLDGISSKIPIGETDAIEHWGRLISGIAVSLLFLGGWAGQCEKLDIGWPARILVGIAICLACITVTWWAEDRLIDFYIRRSTADITLELGLLFALVIAGFLSLRAWLRYSVREEQCEYRRVVIGLGVILVVGYVLIRGVSAVLPSHPERLGLERQRAATLTLVRKGIQQGYYALVGVERDERALVSPEGKAFLALFPVFGKVLDQDRFARDRPFLLAEAMYRDWDEQNGAQAFAAFQDAVNRLRTTTLDSYAAASQTYLTETGTLGVAAAKKHWDETSSALLDGEAIAPGLDKQAFLHDAAEPLPVQADRLFRLPVRCRHGPAGVRSRILQMDAGEQRQAGDRVLRLFQELRERARRRACGAYLLGPHLGAALFDARRVHQHLQVDRLGYRVRATGDLRPDQGGRLAAGQSHRPQQPRPDGGGCAGHGAVHLLRRQPHHGARALSRGALADVAASPIVGGIAAHWTVNAQGLIYPFTRHFRPSWLAFDEDPLAKVPFLSMLYSRDDE